MAGRAGGRRGPTARGTAAGQRQDAGNKQWRVLRLKPPPAGQETSEASRSIAALNAMTFGGRSVVADPHADAAEEDLARVLEQQIGLPDTLARVIVEDGVHAASTGALGAALTWMSDRVEEDMVKKLASAIARKAEGELEQRLARRQGEAFLALPRERRKARARRARRAWQCLYAVKGDDSTSVAGAVLVYTAFPTAPLPPPLPVFSSRHVRSAYIANLCVRADVRRTGVATALMDKAEQTARRWGYSCVYLHVHKRNAPAIMAYERRGYSVVERLLEKEALEDEGGLMSRIKRWSATPYERTGESLMRKVL